VSDAIALFGDDQLGKRRVELRGPGHVRESHERGQLRRFSPTGDRKGDLVEPEVSVPVEEGR
jgi:hypothetical protein